MPLSPPPNDEHGVVPHDHQEIADNDRVLRRVSTELTVFDPKIGGRRLSSMAFRKSSGPRGGMSVDLECLIVEAGHDVRQWVTSPRWAGSVVFRVGDLRAERLQVGFDPLPDNPYHGEVWGEFTKAQQRTLARSCAWFVPIPDVSLV